MMKFLSLGFLVFVTLNGCGDAGEDTPQPGVAQLAGTGSDSEGQQRWYNQGQLEHGAQVFSENCAVCHGDQAQGLVEDWRQRLPDGSFPPPPLNGSAHAWHHPIGQLTEIIDTGGAPYGGQMPPFSDVLNGDDKLAAIAYFQSFWDETTYLGWLDLGGLD